MGEERRWALAVSEEGREWKGCCREDRGASRRPWDCFKLRIYTYYSRDVRLLRMQMSET
jgi:hypothetical protein